MIEEDALPLTETKVDEWVEQAAARYFTPERFPSEADARRAFRGALYRPRHLPLVRSVFIGLGGRIWVQREDLETAHVRWDVFGEEEERPAVVLGPQDAVLLAASGDLVWGVVTNEFDVPHIVRYRIKKEPPSFRQPR